MRPRLLTAAWFALVLMGACAGETFSSGTASPPKAGSGGDAGSGGEGAATELGGTGGTTRGGAAGNGTGGTSQAGEGAAEPGGEAGIGGSGGGGSGGRGGGAGRGQGGAAAGTGGSSAGGSGGAGSGGAPTRAPFIELKVEGYGRANAFTISGDGTYVAGEASNGIEQQAVRWTNEVPLLLGLKTGWTGASGRGISDDGSVVVGEVYTATRSLALRWDDGVLGVLTPLAAGTTIYAQATSVSGDGGVTVGLSQTEVGGEPAPVRWIGEAGQGLPLLDSHGSATPLGVDHDGGTIVGTGLDKDTFAKEAVRWPANGVVPLGLPGTEALAVSDDGHYAVGTYLDTSMTGTQYRQAFRWSADGFDFLPPPSDGGLDCVATAVSGDGSIVVGRCSETVDGIFVNHLFLWSEGTGSVAFETILEQLGVDTSSYEFVDIADISSDGTAVTGNCMAEGAQIGYRASIGGEFP